MVYQSGYPDTVGKVDPGSDRSQPGGAPLWVWLVGIPVIGTSLALFISMTVPTILGAGMGGGGH